MSKAPPHDTTQVFVHQGKVIKTAIRARLGQYESEKKACLQKIADELHRVAAKSTPPDDPAKVAAALVVSLAHGAGLTGEALVVKGFIDRAAFLSEELYSLSCVVKNLSQEEEYKVTLREAQRYGLV